jgi:hypothetical protein
MSVLAYSEMLKRIAGVDKNKLERPFIILSKHNTTEKRLNILRRMAEHDGITIGKLLKLSHQNTGGGSYLTIQRYFKELQKDGLLDVKLKNNKHIWSFSDEYSDIREFILR